MLRAVPAAVVLGVPIAIPITAIPVGQSTLLVAPVAVPVGAGKIRYRLLRSSGASPIAASGAQLTMLLESSPDNLNWRLFQSIPPDPASVDDYSMTTTLAGEAFFRASLNNPGAVAVTTSGDLTFL